MEIVDLTRPLGPETPVFPGDPPVTLARVATHDSDGYEVTQICLGSHSGTHIDAPRHFFADGATLSDYPVERFVGEGVIIDVRMAPCGIVEREFLAPRLDQSEVERGDFVLLWTRGPDPGSADTPPGVTLSPDAAALLLEKGVTLVGTDAPDLDAEGGSYPVHRLLLGAGVLLAENLCNLGRLGPGRVQCLLLPLAVKDADGAPVRAVAWKLPA